MNNIILKLLKLDDHTLINKSSRTGKFDIIAGTILVVVSIPFGMFIRNSLTHVRRVTIESSSKTCPHMDDHQSELVRLATEMTFDSLNVIDYLSFMIWLFIVFSGIYVIYLGMKYIRYAQIIDELNPNQNLQPTPLNADDEKDAQGGAAEI